jgi:DNA helicase-2/ATP-dependent DNA helicase PcrA
VSAFRKFLGAWEEKSETRSLREFMEYFQYFLDAGGKIEVPEPEEPSNAVQMMTVHAAKGLEFPVVFILSVAPRRFPHSEQKPVIQFPDELRKGPPPPPDIHLQEERRLFFVAMTRAEERLYVSSVAKPGKKPSAFVDDLLSYAAVAARDIERIQVAAVSDEEAASPSPTRLTLSEPRLRGEAQPGLFSEPAASSVYPNLVEWANRPPAISPDGKLLLSATAIESYRDCPLKFKFSHYLKIPTGPQPALTFGNIMHQAVRYFVEQRKMMKSPPEFEAVERFYLNAWRDVGFEDAYQEQAYMKAGLEQLRGFVEREKESGVPAEKIRTEEFFRLDLGEVVLEGRIDQIQPLGAGDDHAVELIDYKTGRPRSQKDADQSLQLSIYALAARDQLKVKPARLTFYNLTNNQPVSTARTGGDLDKALKEVREVADEIRRLLFRPTPGFTCRYCDFVPVCPAHEEKF